MGVWCVQVCMGIWDGVYGEGKVWYGDERLGCKGNR